MPPGDAAAKARQRARNGTRSGSSGAGGLVERMQRRTFDEIEDRAQDGPFFAGHIVDMRVLANRTVSLSIIVPTAYIHEVGDLVVESAAMFAFFRSSLIPRRAFLADDSEDEDEDDEDDKLEDDD